MSQPARWISLASLTFVLSSCQSLPFFRDDQTSVVYALGSAEEFPSPISQKLKPACPALSFTGDGFTPVGRHQPRLRELASTWQKQPQCLIIVGYTAPNLPPDYARALSERRAQGVRQALIELGIEASQMQTIGLGNDFSPSSPSSNVVVIYQATPLTTPPPAPSEPVLSAPL